VVPVALDVRLRELATNMITWAPTMSHGNKSKSRGTAEDQALDARRPHRAVRAGDRRVA
jgi:hypothetical protein